MSAQRRPPPPPLQLGAYREHRGCALYPYVGKTRSEEKNTILYSDLASKWNNLEPINGISLNILGNMIVYSIWASPRDIHIRIPHVGLYPWRRAIDSSCECEHHNPDFLDARLFPSVVFFACCNHGRSIFSVESLYI